MNFNSSVLFGRYDSTNTVCCGLWVEAVAKPLSYGDSINSKNAAWLGSSLSLTNNSSIGTAPGDYKNITDWIDSVDKYIGIMYQNGIDTMYGWIRINIPSSNKCYVKDYSLGGGGLGMEEIELLNINLYPNPASDKLQVNIIGHPKAKISLLDVYGRKIRITQQTEIDVNDLKEGIYFVQIKTAEGITVKKIIVQR